MIGKIEIGGQVGRQIDRMIGRLPALDKALVKRLPIAGDEMGRVVTNRARSWAPRLSGALAGGTGYQIRGGTTLAIGIWGIPHAGFIDFGMNSNELVPRHSRRQTQVFGEDMIPKRVEVGTFVRHMKFKGRDFLHRAYYGSFSAMFGIMNKIIGEAQKEADFVD